MSQPRWHAALAYAVLGHAPADLPEPGRPVVAQLLTDLDACVPGGLAAIRTALAAAGVSRLPAHAVPDDLRAGLPAAQWFAALVALQSALCPPRPVRIRSTRPLDGDEQRLEADVPPHHGA